MSVMPFNSTKQCRKCGGRSFGRTHSANHRNGGHYYDVLLVECKTCQYRLEEYSKDYVPQKKQNYQRGEE